MFSRHTTSRTDGLLSSKLYDQDSFYQALARDLANARRQVIIESPFITAKRMQIFLPVFKRLTSKGVQIIVNTKPLSELETGFSDQAGLAITQMQAIGVTVLLTVGHHRKIAIIDEQIVWEGSLNILSQNDSCEFMRRIYSGQLVNQMLVFLHLEKFTKVG